MNANNSFTRRKGIVPWIWFLALIIAGSLPAAAQSHVYPQRWNYIRPNLDTDDGLRDFLTVLKESKDVGCTHILINDGRYLRQADNPDYLARVAAVRALADSLHLVIVPSVYAFGYSGRYLGFDHNLAAGLPVKNMPFIVHGKTARPDPALAPDLSGLDSTGSGPIAVRPFTHYRITFFLKTHPERSDNLISANSPHRRHVRGYPRITEEKGRYRVTATFNSLDADSLTLRVRSESPIENLTIEPAGTLMILRRALTPLKVTSADGRTIYTEGKDFEPVRDAVIAASSGELDMDHSPAPIVLTPHTRIRDGQTLLVSFFHAYRLLDDQDVISLEDPAVIPLMERDVALCAKVWQPTDYFMNYDEIRIGGWERPDVPPGKTLAENVRKGYDIIKQHAPEARIYTWSDMFTPYHNARPYADRQQDYYLVNGTWDESWQGLPPDVIVLNWYAREKEALAFFADRGNPQVLCGYYDARDETRLKQNVARWMTLSENIPNILGFMYTTWKHNYADMPTFFHLLDTYDTWHPTFVAPEKK